jgi:hypothetical protein
MSVGGVWDCCFGLIFASIFVIIPVLIESHGQRMSPLLFLAARKWRLGCQMAYVFSNQKSRFGHILEGLSMLEVGILCAFGIFYIWCINYMSIWYIFRLFGIFFPFWYVAARQIRQPLLEDGFQATHMFVSDAARTKPWPPRSQPGS